MTAPEPSYWFVVDSTPRNAVPPMWIASEPSPLSIWWTIDTALLIGIAKPWLVVEYATLLLTEAAVSIPITSPDAFRSGPPESPGRTAAFVSIRPLRFSLPPCSSLTLIERPRPVTVPDAEISLPVPPAFPSARTDSPASTESESPMGVVFRFEAPLACRTATSSETE